MTDTVTTPELTFDDAEYVAPHGGSGRGAEPNPYTAVIAAIALKVDEKTKKPVAKSCVLTHGNTPEDRQKATNKAIRQFTIAGEKNDPQVTVHRVFEPVKNPVNKKESATQTKVVFWTTAKQRRPRAVKNGDTPTAETSTE